MNVYELMAKITLDDKSYKKGISGIEKSGKTFSERLKSGFTKIAVAATAGAVAIGAVTKKVINAAGEVAEYGDNIDKMSQKMGISIAGYQEWDAVMQHCGTSMDSLKVSMKTLANAAESGNEAFERIGITQQQIASMSQEELFNATIEGLQNVTDTTERTYLAGKLLGRGATELGALLNLTAEETQAMKDRVHELGGVMSDEAVKAAAAYQDQLQDLTTAFDSVKRNAVSKLLPGLTMVMAGLTDILSGTGSGGQIAQGLEQIQNVLEKGLPRIVNDVLPAFLQAFVVLISAVIDALPAIVSAIAEVAPDLILALIEGIVENIDLLVEAAVALIEGLIEGIDEALPVIIAHAPEIVAALIRGILASNIALIEGAAQIIKMLVKGLISKAKDMFNAGKKIAKQLKDGVSPVELAKDLVMKILKGIGSLFKPFGDSAYKSGKEFGEKLKQGISSKIEAVRSAIAAIISAIKTKIQELINSAMSMGQSIINNFTAPLRAGISVARSIASSIASAVKSPLSALVGAMGGIGSSIGSRFASALRSALSGAAGVARSAASGIKSAFTSLISAAYNWGADLGRKFASGVTATISAVRRTISNLASQVRSLLHFSEPDEGPLSDFHTYAPDMMRLFAEGVTKNAHLVSSAVEDAFDLGGIVTAGFNGATVNSAEVQRSGLVMTFADAVEAFKTALGEVAVELDDDEVGSFVRRTVVKSVYA